MTELPEVPFYFKHKGTGVIFKVKSITTSNLVRFFQKFHAEDMKIESVGRAECLIKEKIWIICDQKGNEIKEKKQDTEEYRLLIKEHGNKAVKAMETNFYFATLPPLDEAMGDWKDECFRMLEDDTRKPSLYTKKLGNYFDYKEKKMREFAKDFLRKEGLFFGLELKGRSSNSTLLELLRKYDKDKKECQEKNASTKYITRDKDYTGCPEEIAELLKQGKEIEGVAWDRTRKYQEKVCLLAFNNHSNCAYPFAVRLTDGANDEFMNFTPTPAKQSTTCVRTLIENGVDIPVDTKVVYTDKNYNTHRGYYAGSNVGLAMVWVDGKTSYSVENGHKRAYSKVHLLEPVEYTPKGE